MKQRQVVVYTDYTQKDEEYRATFHQFGCSYEESGYGFGNYSTAIVEKEDGKILNPAVERIKFIS